MSTSEIQSYNVQNLETKDLHGFLLGAVAPRPIAFVSTVNDEGKVNLSPYSFFNVFSANPPIMIFSPARRVRDNTTKHTLENVLKTKECVINAVSYDIVQQASLASTEYAEGVNEFVKAGFTEVASDLIRPPRVAESKAAFECKVRDVISLGNEGGAGNLVICEVLKIHLHNNVLDENGRIDTQKMNLVGRMGGAWYTESFGDSLFTIPKPLSTLGIGFDQLPQEILLSKVFTGNDLAMLANVEILPEGNAVSDEMIHQKAKEALEKKNVQAAWDLLIQ